MHTAAVPYYHHVHALYLFSYSIKPTDPPDATDESAPYVERSVIPLNPLGWTTFREIGCFSRNRRYRRRASKTTEVKLPGDRRTPKECAALCSFKMGGGVGFFGISDGDR